MTNFLRTRTLLSFVRYLHNKMPDYRNTINLPITAFPLKASPQQEVEILKKWKLLNPYHEIKTRRQNAPSYVLHCGPPYANGPLHTGHALTMVLKDITVRAKFMEGFNVSFVPGWDCHGLPIEWKVERDLLKLGKHKKDISPLELIDLCRREAKLWMDIQKQDWQRFGCIGDWERPYYTMRPETEASIYRQLVQLFLDDKLKKGTKPTWWSTTEETALAEAEVEYADKKSTEAYVIFPMNSIEGVVIWTTTPWTIPLNQAVAFNKNLNYICIELLDKNLFCKRLWIAKNSLESFCKIAQIASYIIIHEETGNHLENKYCIHPFYNRTIPLVHGDHVTGEKGSGFVHIAPAHGLDDFEIGQRYGLDIDCYVDGKGVYDEKIPLFGGKSIKKTENEIIEHLKTSHHLIYGGEFIHSSPISWRSKDPLIIRTSPQWFIELEETGIRKKAMEAVVNDVEWKPNTARNRILNMLKDRPSWCISRQRVWGVPIALIRNSLTDEYIHDSLVYQYIANLIAKFGIEAWYKLDVNEMLVKNFNYPSDQQYVKEDCILDVWFDSGSSFRYVLDKSKGEFPADLYLEGSDQARGWFQSSLLLSIALEQCAPYKKVLTHGFVVNSDGHKMSKSLGNSIEPKELIDKYGMDIVRIWVAQADHSMDVKISNRNLEVAAACYNKLRNTIRFLLGNLRDYPEQTKKHVGELSKLERCLLSKIYSTFIKVQSLYLTQDFHEALKLITNLCVTDLSGVYFSARKDSLYCDGISSPIRQGCLTTCMHLLRTLLTHLHPVVPFLTHEAWQCQFEDKQEPIYLHTFYLENGWNNEHLLNTWEILLKIRSLLYPKLENMVKNKHIQVFSQADIIIYLPLGLKQHCEEIDMRSFLNVASVKLFIEDTVTDDAQMMDLSEKIKFNISHTTGCKCSRCWNYNDEQSSKEDLCVRCETVIGGINEVSNQTISLKPILNKVKP